MAFEVLMPRLGSTMEEGRIVEWKKNEICMMWNKKRIKQIENQKINGGCIELIEEYKFK